MPLLPRSISAMSTTHRSVLGLFIFGVVLTTTGCPGDFEGGYEKVAFRQHPQLAMAVAPDPPPAVAGFGATAAVTPALPTNAPPGVTLETVEEGQRLYGTICTACHGPGATGTPAGPALGDQNWIHIDGSFDQIVSIIQSGVSNPVEYPGAMPPLGGGNFDADQVRAIAAYLFALSQQPPA